MERGELRGEASNGSSPNRISHPRGKVTFHIHKNSPAATESNAIYPGGQTDNLHTCTHTPLRWQVWLAGGKAGLASYSSS